MIVLDTNALLWLAQVPSLLSASAHEAIREARERGGLAISDKVLWEIAMLVSRGRVGVKTTLQDFLQAIEARFVVLPVNSAIAVRSVQFSPRFPKDPSDRIIAATALVHGFKLVTADQAIRQSGEVPCIW